MVGENEPYTYQDFEKQRSQEVTKDVGRKREALSVGSLLEKYWGLTATGKLAVWVAILLPIWVIGSVDPMYYPGIAAAIALIAAIATVAGVATGVTNLRSTVQWQQRQTEHQSLTLTAQLMSNMEDRWDKMLDTRKDAARVLLGDKPVTGTREELVSTVEVLGFFQTMANLANRGALDKGFVWDQYYLHMHMYWHFAQRFFEPDIKENPMFWRDLRERLEDFHEFDNYKNRSFGVEPKAPRGDAELRIYLSGELSRERMR